MALETEEQDPEGIDERAQIPDGGFLMVDNGEDLTTQNINSEEKDKDLPSYEPLVQLGVSPNAPLKLIDCHNAMRATIRKARLLVFEIARQDRPFYRRHAKEITLKGSIRDLDIILSSTTSCFKYLVDVPYFVHGDGIMRSLLTWAILGDGNMKESTSTYFAAPTYLSIQNKKRVRY